MRAPPAPANRATPDRRSSPRRKGRSGRCTNGRPKGCPTGRNTARCPRRPAASPLWPTRAPRRPVPRVSRRFLATPRCTCPSLARARRRAARRARPRSSARTAVPLRTPELTRVPHSALARRSRVVDVDAGGLSRLAASMSSVAATVAPSVRIVPATAVARARVSGVRVVLSAADRDSVVGVGPSCAAPMPRSATRPAQYGWSTSWGITT